MTKVSCAQTPQRISAAKKKARQLLATAFLRAVTEAGSSQERAARTIGVAKRTVGAWARCERSITVEDVLAAPRIGPAFRVALCAHNHDSEEFAPYLAKRKARSSR